MIQQFASTGDNKPSIFMPLCLSTTWRRLTRSMEINLNVL